MNKRQHLLIFLLVFVVESSWVTFKYRNSEPQVGDAAEVHNIAWNLARGRGFRFDWNDPDWRKLWQAQNVDGRFDFIIVRRGSHATLSRPPLMPILVAGVIRICPHLSFLAWRWVDSALFAIAACLLWEVAFVHGGLPTLLCMLLLILADPWRRDFIPGWWTEGLAFDFICGLVWLIANGRCLKPGNYIFACGITVGLLCLDRSIFAMLTPLLAVLLAIAQTRGRSAWIKQSVAILIIAMLVQSPWWIRNIQVAGRLLPLGTQGGINLPDQYSDAAVSTNGVWTGRGMRNAWAPPGSAHLAEPPPTGMSEADVEKLWPFDLRDRPAQQLIAALFCRTTDSEIAVSDAGTRAGLQWARSHPATIPHLMLAKAWSLTRYLRIPLAAAGCISFMGLIGLPQQRRLILLQSGLIAICVLGVVLTHVVNVRFMLPIFPPIYVLSALGLGLIARSIFQVGHTPSKTSAAGPVI